MTWPTTLGDDPKLMEQYAVDQEGFDATCAHTQVFAPCCHRRTPADTVVSLKGLQTEIRAGNILPKQDLEWACDGCLHLLILDKSNGWTWSNLYTALGAPDDVIRHYLSLEVLDEYRADANARKEAFNPGDIFDTAYANLPPDLANDLSTRRPDATSTK